MTGDVSRLDSYGADGGTAGQLTTGELMAVPAGEVLILDSNIFISEIGLTSRDGSALKHYLYCRGMRLVVPEVVAEECERHLTNEAKGKANEHRRESAAASSLLRGSEGMGRP